MRQEASRSAGASALLALSVLAASSEARAAEDESEAIVFEYEAPRRCPSSEQVLRQIAAYTTKWTIARPGEEARRFVLRIARRGGVYVGRFELREVAGETVGRDITGDICEDVALGLAVAVATAIDHRAPSPETPSTVLAGNSEPSSPQPVEHPPPAPADEPKRTAMIPTPSRAPRRVAIAVGARGEGNNAVSGLLAVMDVYLEMEWDASIEQLPWLRPVLRAGFRRSLPRTNRVGQTEADIGWSAGHVDVCPSRFLLASRLSMEGCLSSNIGMLSAQARDIPGAGTTRRWWFDYGAVLSVRWQIHPHLFAETVGAVWVPITRDRLRVEPDGVVTEAPPAGLSLGMGIGWRF